ncbi:uncharacterized protein PHALS_00807 [Plasmopara halstedii]|uniref:Uncharacterized protein n=1 Tax=Plasmopara halstedii TaxID=4781 RepID=A0A0P1ATI2_PLAHL|nr:uncharacterized protein PHALS_00807 [Plasmopara halstedii]CEG44440.1 hypothetical protein PHALS_00807 [Plasmopara halstedii]|eukprot:XP_024580809.1 hypothetical protein PHALS_00807 [Plasmopara halstedii]
MHLFNDTPTKPNLYISVTAVKDSGLYHKERPLLRLCLTVWWFDCLGRSEKLS